MVDPFGGASNERRAGGTRRKTDASERSGLIRNDHVRLVDIGLPARSRTPVVTVAR